MEKRNICLIKLSGREILIDKNNSFLEFNEIKDGREIIENIRESIKSEFEYTNIILEDKRQLTYYEEEVVAYVINIEGAKVKSELKELKVLNRKRDKIDAIYGNIIDNLYSTYGFYVGATSKKYTIESVKEKRINRWDLVFSILIGFSIGIFMFLGTDPYSDYKIFNVFGIWVTLLWFLIVGYIFIVKKVNAENKFGGFLVLSGLILSVCFTIFANEQLKVINFFLIPVLILFGSRLMIQKEKEIEIFNFVIDAITFTFFKAFGKIPSIRFNVGIEKKNGKLVKDISIGLIISVPVLFVLGGILSNANAGFESFLANLITFKWSPQYSTVAIIITGSFYSLYFMGMMKALNTVYEAKETRKIDKSINFTILNTVVTMVNLLYVVFTVTSFQTNGRSYAEQARTGFFQLILVVVINIVFIIYFAKINLKKYTEYSFVVMLVLSIGMGINSIAGLMSYIGFYGLTRLRFISTVFSVFLIIVLGLLIVNSFKKFKVWYFIISVGIVMYIGVNYCNMDNIIAKYNLNKIEMSKSYNVSDLYYYAYLSKDCKNTLIEAREKGIFSIENYKGEKGEWIESDYKYLNENLDEIIKGNGNEKWFEFNYYNN